MSWRSREATAIALALTATAGVACGGNDAGGVRERDADELQRAGMFASAGNGEVVKALTTPRAPGRIVYDPPTDLSLANAMRTRPDLVGGDSARGASGRTARRDSTAGDATADTSGGAARRRRRP